MISLRFCRVRFPLEDRVESGPVGYGSSELMLFSQLTTIAGIELRTVLDLVASSQNHVEINHESLQAEASFCAFS